MEILRKDKTQTYNQWAPGKLKADPKKPDAYWQVDQGKSDTVSISNFLMGDKPSNQVIATDKNDKVDFLEGSWHLDKSAPNKGKGVTDDTSHATGDLYVDDKGNKVLVTGGAEVKTGTFKFDPKKDDKKTDGKKDDKKTEDKKDDKKTDGKKDDKKTEDKKDDKKPDDKKDDKKFEDKSVYGQAGYTASKDGKFDGEGTAKNLVKDVNGLIGGQGDGNDKLTKDEISDAITTTSQHKDTVENADAKLSILKGLDDKFDSLKNKDGTIHQDELGKSLEHKDGKTGVKAPPKDEKSDKPDKADKPKEDKKPETPKKSDAKQFTNDIFQIEANQQTKHKTGEINKKITKEDITTALKDGVFDGKSKVTNQGKNNHYYEELAKKLGKNKSFWEDVVKNFSKYDVKNGDNAANDGIIDADDLAKQGANLPK